MNSSLKERATMLAERHDTEQAGKRLAQEHVEAVEDAKAVEFSVERMKGRAKVKVTAKLDDEILAVESLDLSDSKARARFAEKLASAGAGDLAEIDSRLLGLAAVPTTEAAPKSTEREALLAEHDAETKGLLDGMPGDVVEEAKARLRDPKLLDRIMGDIEAVGVVGERPLAASCYLIGVSRLLRRPLAGIIQGVSSSGKSYVPATVSTLFPPETLLKAHGITANALYYMDAGSLMHRWVLAGERPRQQDEAQADATKALREMLAEGELTKLVTERGPDGANITRRVHQHGPISFTESTTSAVVFDEDLNRMLPLASDESSEQSRRVITAQAARAAGAGRDTLRTVAVNHAMQRLLKRVAVRIPFAERLAAAVPCNRPESRRAFQHLLSMIEASALLHQYLRLGNPEHGAVIDAEILDYVVAARLLGGALGRALGEGLPPAVVNFGKRCWATFSGSTFTTKDARQKDASLKSKSKVNEYLTALADAGLAERATEAKGPIPATWRMLGDATDGRATWLPDAKDIGGRHA